MDLILCQKTNIWYCNSVLTRTARVGALEAVISRRIRVQELEPNLISYLLFRGSKLIGFERFFDLVLITVDKL